MDVLNQFILRLSFGLSLAMAFTSPRWVTAGFYRNHSYVLLGLTALASMVAVREPGAFRLWPALTSAILSYAAAVAWLYEKPKPGQALLGAIAIVSLVGAILSLRTSAGSPAEKTVAMSLLWSLDAATGGLLLGVTIAAMFLGHWYLNSPTMELAPLRRLVLTMAAAAIARGLLAAVGLGLSVSTDGWPAGSQASFLALRWISAIAGVLGLTWMSWQTLKIPNTQAATGILYVAVIAVFLGELTAQLLSRASAFPL